MDTNIRIGADGSKYRHCSRCLSELTDMASLEAGIGPTCRQLTNTLYSRTISANLPAAVALILAIKDEELPEPTIERFAKAKVRLLKIAEKAAQQGSIFDPTKKGFDLREVIETLDWTLSFQVTPTQKSLIAKTVFHLGYTGLAGVLLQQSSTGEAKIWFETGRLYLSGPSCKAGYEAFRKIDGVTTPRYRGDKRPFTVPAQHFDKFKTVVLTYWPNFSGDLHELEKISRAWTEAEKRMAGRPPVLISASGELVLGQPEESSPEETNSTSSPYSGKPLANFAIRSSDFVLSMPWLKQQNARMFAIIAEIKDKVPPNLRRYNPEDKTWAIANSHKETVKAILDGHYDIQEVLTGEPTPPPPQKSTMRFRRPSAGEYSKTGASEEVVELKKARKR